MDESERGIKPNDIVRHIPSGEIWIVCGVNPETGTLIPKGYPFPTMAKIAECELIEKRYETEPQDLTSIRALLESGLDGYVDHSSGAFQILAMIARHKGA